MNSYDETWLAHRLAANPDLRRVNAGISVENAPKTDARYDASWQVANVAGRGNKAAKTGIPVSVTLTLPWPPHANNLYATGRDARRHLTKQGRAYRRAVKAAVWAQHLQSGYLAGLFPLQGRLAVTFWLFPPDRRTRDVVNAEKAISDALGAKGCAFYRDDSQFDEVHFYRGAVRRPPGVVVTILQQ